MSAAEITMNCKEEGMRVGMYKRTVVSEAGIDTRTQIAHAVYIMHTFTYWEVYDVLHLGHLSWATGEPLQWHYI